MACAKKPKKPKKVPISKQEQELTRQFQTRWTNYQQHYVPFENHQIQQLEELRSAGEQAEAENVAAAGANERMSALAPIVPGMKSGSGAHISNAVALENSRGGAVAQALVEGQQAQEDRFQSGRQRIIDYGVGKDSVAAQITGRAASLAAQNNSIDTAQRNQNQKIGDEFWDDVIGTAAGAAVNAYAGGAGAGGWGSTGQTGKINTASNQAHQQVPYYPAGARVG